MPTNVVVPQLGESVVEARVARWLKKAGDAVSPGEPDRRTRDREDRPRGRRRAGGRHQRDRSPGRRGREGRRVAGRHRRRGRRAPAAAPPRPVSAAARRAARGAGAGEPPSDARDGQRATPTARKLAAEHAIDLGQVAASGEGGRVVKRDVEAASRRPRRRLARRRRTGQPRPPARRQRPRLLHARPAPLPSAPVVQSPARKPGDRTEERQRMSKRRLTIARNLVEAQRTAAMLTTFNEIDMSAVMALPRAPQGRVQEGARRRAGHRVVLREGALSARCRPSRASTPRSRARTSS